MLKTKSKKTTAAGRVNVQRRVGRTPLEKPKDGLWDVLLFEIQDKNGHSFSIYLNGIIEGFGDDAIIINYALPLVSKLISKSVGEKKFTSLHTMCGLGVRPSAAGGYIALADKWVETAKKTKSDSDNKAVRYFVKLKWLVKVRTLRRCAKELRAI